jgi:hypothetical protein
VERGEVEDISKTHKKGEITMSTPTEKPNVSENPNFEPFPETQTIPSGWDLSGITPDPEPAPADPVEDSPET